MSQGAIQITNERHTLAEQLVSVVESISLIVHYQAIAMIVQKVLSCGQCRVSFRFLVSIGKLPWLWTDSEHPTLLVIVRCEDLCGLVIEAVGAPKVVQVQHSSVELVSKAKGASSSYCARSNAFLVVMYREVPEVDVRWQRFTEGPGQHQTPCPSISLD